MKKLFTAFAVLVFISGANCVARAQSSAQSPPFSLDTRPSSVPFTATAQINGQVMVPAYASTLVPRPVVKVVRVPDIGIITDLNRQLGAKDEEIRQLKEQLDKKVEPKPDDMSHCLWLALIGLVIGVIIGALLRGGGSSTTTNYYGRREEGGTATPTSSAPSPVATPPAPAQLNVAQAEAKAEQARQTGIGIEAILALTAAVTTALALSQEIVKLKNRKDKKETTEPEGTATS